MRPRFFIAVFIVGVGAYSVAEMAHAERPHVSYIFPAGGQRGTNVQVRVGGHYLHEKCPFEMTGAGIMASSEIQLADKTIWFEGPLIYFPASSQKEDYPKDYLGHVEIAADAPLGMRYWRVSTSQGVTPAMRFVVGDLPEVIEQETDGRPIPTSVEVPLTINGRIYPREDVDVWTFNAPAGRPITCSVTAAQIGSPLDARLEVRGPDGAFVAETTGTAGHDPTLRLTTPLDGTYQVRIHDVNFDGLQHFVYRLTITDGPWIERVYPLGAQRGTDVKLQLGGQNATADPVALRIPDDASSEFVHRIESNGRLSNPIILDVDNLPERLEAEPNDTMEQAALIEVPSMLNGRIDQPGDVDGWSFDAVKDQAIEFEVRAARLGSLLDSVIVIEDLTGKELARNDDAEASDSRLQWKAPAEGKYLVKISERFSSRGGEAFAYRLRVAPPEPNFDLRLSSDALSVDRNGAQKLEIQVYRFGGFAEPITLSAVDLPEGVTCADVEVKGNQPQAKAQLEFKAAETARVDVSRIRIVGRATLNDQAIERAATFQFGRGEPALDQLTLAVAEPTPFKFAGVYEFSFASRGGTHHKLYTIERNGYDGPLEVRLADRQTRHLQGIEGPTITVPVGATEFEYPVYLAPWMELGRTSRSVLMLTGEVTDGQGQRHKVCYSSGNQNDQIIIRVSPGLLRLVPERKTLIAEAQSTAKLLVQVKRDRTLDTPVRVELVVPDHMRDISCEPVDLNPNDDAAELTIQFGSAPGPLNMPILIRATSWVGEDRFIGETPLELVEGPSSVGRK